MKKILLAVSFLIIFPATVFTQNLSDYLITNDIGSYIKITSCGPTSSILAGADHFYLDHSDTALGISYVNDTQKMWVKVEVTKHTGGDSDRWLLHEVEDSLRDGELETIGKLSSGVRLREINGNKIISLRGSVYRWLSNKIVVNVSYTDLQGNKPEPLEVIQAYLSKFPSTIIITPADFKGDAHNVQWIKDEMERRLWLCDKWNAQYQAGGMKQADLIYNLILNMKEFLNYRQKYYSMSADAELTALYGYQRNNDITSIQNKLTEYKTWWTKHKDKRISL